MTTKQTVQALETRFNAFSPRDRQRFLEALVLAQRSVALLDPRDAAAQRATVSITDTSAHGLWRNMGRGVKAGERARARWDALKKLGESIGLLKPGPTPSSSYLWTAEADDLVEYLTTVHGAAGGAVTVLPNLAEKCALRAVDQQGGLEEAQRMVRDLRSRWLDVDVESVNHHTILMQLLIFWRHFAKARGEGGVVATQLDYRGRVRPLESKSTTTPLLLPRPLFELLVVLQNAEEKKEKQTAFLNQNAVAMARLLAEEVLGLDLGTAGSLYLLPSSAFSSAKFPESTEALVEVFRARIKQLEEEQAAAVKTLPLLYQLVTPGNRQRLEAARAQLLATIAEKV